MFINYATTHCLFLKRLAKARPSYPKEAIQRLSALLTPGASILDLGAGTGIMTKLLVKEGYQVVAVEPVKAMRDQLTSSLPSVTCLEGTAQSIPLESNSVDAVMLAQCFHWFDNLESLEEIHRVLKPNGLIVLIWNMESQERSEWVFRIRALYQAYEDGAPQYRKGHWKKVFETNEAQALYTFPLQHQVFQFDTPAKRADIWTRVMSKSYIAILEEKEQEILKNDIENVLEDPKYGLPKNQDLQTELIYPHDTDMYWCNVKK